MGEALRSARARLVTALALEPDAARIEAYALLGHVLAQPRAFLLANANEALAAPQQVAFEALVQRRCQGEPIAYLTGKREFYGLALRVSPAVLIPRPETELLVELALSRLPPDAPYQVLDLGTGNGAVALAIAHERPACSVTACDADPAALACARDNAALFKLPVSFLQTDWFEGLPAGRFDLIVSNPPYIAESDPHLAQGDLRFEPRTALASGPDGLDAIRQIVRTAAAWLKPGGVLLFEHGYEQGEACRNLLHGSGFKLVHTYKDLAGHDRVTGGAN